ncbi:hypothetical protein CRUP_018376, partial [Coryphaenoides rupestris]
MKKDIETLIAEERADILTKYDKGKQEGTDPWEDADYKVYKQKLLEVERVEKWLKMAWLSFPGLTPHNRFPPGR